MAIIDLPGIYSLTPTDTAERVTKEFLLHNRPDVVVVVMDASVLSRSLELLLEVMELQLPVVVALNMMDEAGRKGVEVDVKALSERLGVVVVPMVATYGLGVKELAIEAAKAAEKKTAYRSPVYDRDVEEAISRLLDRMPAGLADKIGAPARFVATRLLQTDPEIEDVASKFDKEYVELASRLRRELADIHDWPEEGVFASHRHAVAVDLFEAVARVVPRRKRSLGEKADSILTHPLYGLLAAAAAFVAMFFVAFIGGGWVSQIMASPFEAVLENVEPLARNSFIWSLVKGFVEGIAGGAGIVLPYLVPLLLVMTIYEDTGYLPRVAFLLDGLLHRLGLHGKSVVPLILAYGCSVPAVMATRTLETQRDRLLTAILVPLTPCSARTVVILALVAGLVGPFWAAALYLLDLVVIALVAFFVSRFPKGTPSGLLMDVPPYRMPILKLALKKIWFRVYEFLVGAWPVLVIASVVFAALEYSGVQDSINTVLRPLTSELMGLPEETGVPLFFGLLRKELSLMMLASALGTTDIASIMTSTQIITFAVFITFYIPCVATLTTIGREVGWRWAVASGALSFFIALAIAFLISRVDFLLGNC